MHALALSTMSLCQFVIKQTCLGLARARARARMVHDYIASTGLPTWDEKWCVFLSSASAYDS